MDANQEGHLLFWAMSKMWPFIVQSPWVALQKKGVLCLPIKVYVCVCRHKSGFRSPDFPVIVHFCMDLHFFICTWVQETAWPTFTSCRYLWRRFIVSVRYVDQRAGRGVLGDGGAREDVPGDLLHSYGLATLGLFILSLLFRLLFLCVFVCSSI